MSKTIENWIDELASEDKRIRQEAMRALGYMGAAIVPNLIEAMKAQRVYDQVLAHIFEQIGQPAIEELADVLRTGTVQERQQAARMLALIADNRSVLSLIMAFDDPNAEVRWQIAAALGHFSDPRAASRLLDALNDDSMPVRAAAAASLGNYYRDPRVMKALLPLLDDESPLVRSGAVEGLAYIHDERVAKALQTATQDSDENVRHLAAAALQHQQGDRMVFERLKNTRPDIVEQSAEAIERILEDGILNEDDLELMRSSNPRVRARLIELVGDHGAASAVKLILPGLNDINPAVRRTAIESLVRLGQNAVPSLYEALNSPSKFIRAGAIEAVYEIAGEEALDRILPLIKDESKYVRQELIQVLSRIEDNAQVLDTLKHAVKDADRETAQMAETALQKMGYETSNPITRFLRRITGGA